MNKSDFLYLAKKIFERIGQNDYLLLATHENPDGDALSSVCALMCWLDSMGKKYYCYCVSPLSKQFGYLPNFEKIKNVLPASGLADFSTIILADCAVIARSNLSRQIEGRHKGQLLINFDHHPAMEKIVDLDLREESAASTTEVLYRFFTANNVMIDKNIANCLLTGIMTDTANFLYPSTSEDTVKISSDLLLRGANLFQIVKSTWQNKSLESLKIWGTALMNLQINEKYNLAYSLITAEDLGGKNNQEFELDGIAGFLSNLYGVKAVLFLYEEKEGLIKGSLRTAKPEIDVSALAKVFGGGGHKKASGFKIEGKIVTSENGWKII